jgi:predicted membrane protein
MLPVKYSPKFYYPLALLHISLIMRIFGDLTYTHSIRLWGSTLNAIAILLFLMIMGSTIIKGRKEEIEAKKG